MLHRITPTAPRLFMILSDKDVPLYEFYFTSGTKESNYLVQFVTHSALDVVDELQWKVPSVHLKVVDKYNNELLISSMITPGNVRFMLLHEHKNDDAVKQFFNEVRELYVKTLLSPFYKAGEPITSQQFDERVRLVAKKCLRGPKTASKKISV